MRVALLFVVSMAGFPAQVVIDRIAVIVGKSVIKLSDIERNLRLTEFLNREPLNVSVQDRRPAAERLIDQQLIRNEIATGGYTRASDADAEGLLKRLEQDHYAGSATRLDAALERYGLTENELRREFLWQLTVLGFIRQRFQPGVDITDQQVETYYNQHLAELKREYPRENTLAALTPQIRDLLTGQEVNKEFDDWLAQARKRTQIEYRQGAFQ
ncbi:MAG TPA: hypothetical protein VME43_18270 [Bryobacteraceae bacterium]|nr:hypothetical protein [Bryobacteraceae bacterium]